jgi:hypothetical protein
MGKIVFSWFIWGNAYEFPNIGYNITIYPAQKTEQVRAAVTLREVPGCNFGRLPTALIKVCRVILSLSRQISYSTFV